ncbi:DUF983 domain-containing protein [Arachidicoccus ginsenosidimutans]|uniref:DUF983 domain-containing protein n=1 Tax=Arachidicoccus sp. BS20 TaxID=1850526 RepID=UPI0007F1129C|nr:DUF983 domain-containing protein [Arachidicoccus sp. BS20]ANI90324.1 DUF983 domain-containing protein [Arachidicoccus sp. BS20]
METTEIAAVHTSNRHTHKPSFLRLFQCKCPRCREGNMFETQNPYKLKIFMKMNEVCPVCGQPLDLEVGFYYGSSYVSYALTVALSVASFVAWWTLFGISWQNDSIFHWLTFTIILLIIVQPAIMRIARTLWLAIYVRYDKNWKTNPPKKAERMIEEYKNAW